MTTATANTRKTGAATEHKERKPPQGGSGTAPAQGERPAEEPAETADAAEPAAAIPVVMTVKAEGFPEALDEAVAWVMRRRPYVQKTGRMKPQGEGGGEYTYASEADVVGSLNQLMAEVGLTLMPSQCRITLHQQYKTRSGATWNHIEVRVRYTLAWYNPATKKTERRRVEALGAGCDPGDKAVAKAQTMAHKYALRQVFNIELGNDPDEQHSSEQERAGGGQAGQAQQGRQQAQQGDQGRTRQQGGGRTQQAQGGQQQGRQQKEKKDETKETFNAAYTAVGQAPDLAVLAKYQANYRKRSFTKEQIATLDEVAAKRRKELEEAKRKQEEDRRSKEEREKQEEAARDWDDQPSEEEEDIPY